MTKEQIESKIYEKDGTVATVHIKPEDKNEKLKSEEMTVKWVIDYCLRRKDDDINPRSLHRRYKLWSKIQNEDYSFSFFEKRLIRKLVAEKTEILASGQVMQNL